MERTKSGEGHDASCRLEAEATEKPGTSKGMVSILRFKKGGERHRIEESKLRREVVF
jgi:hypothetical protein